MADHVLSDPVQHEVTNAQSDGLLNLHTQM